MRMQFMPTVMCISNSENPQKSNSTWLQYVQFFVPQVGPSWGSFFRSLRSWNFIPHLLNRDAALGKQVARISWAGK